MYQYLITTSIQEPFYTNYFDAENHFNSELDMVVFDLRNHTYTTNGIIWQEIKEDHL